MRRWVRPLDVNDLSALLILLGLFSLVVSLAVRQPYPWLSDLMQNLGASFLIALLALRLVDSVVKAHEQRLEQERWEPVSHHIGHYVGNVARRCALAYRIALGIGDEEISGKFKPDDLETESLAEMAQWIGKRIIPALPGLETIDRSRWAGLLAEIDRADQESKDALLLFGNRLKPDIYRQLVEIRRGIARAKQSCQLFGSLLGGPGEPLFVTRDMHMFPLVEEGLKIGLPKDEVFRIARKNAAEHAADDGRDILLSAMRLLEATIPLIPEGATNQPQREEWQTT